MLARKKIGILRLAQRSLRMTEEADSLRSS
jgi:hypothetical protein